MTSAEGASNLHQRKVVSKSAPTKSEKTGSTKVSISEHSKSFDLSSLASNYSLIGLILIWVLALLPRLYKIYSPAEVVFDEVHFGKFASYYLRREYYFDVHPPLAKMLLALPGKLVGYNGSFLFDKIGMSYRTNGSPYFVMRLTVAMLSSAIPAFVYMIMAESGYSLLISFFAAFFVAFDNALVLHGRLILLDSFLLFFMMASIYSYVRFFKLRYQPFTTNWYTWLLATGVCLGLTVSCKLVGLFTYATVGCLVLFELYRIIDIRRYPSLDDFPKHFYTRFAGLVIVPLVVYLATFYIHFAILTKTGPGDDYHSRKFQMQLIGNPLTIDSKPIYFGDAVSFKHTDTKQYLYSRNATYPLKYEDKRVSSEGQQVTAHPKLNDSAYWVILPELESDVFKKYFESNGTKRDNEKVPSDVLSELKIVHNTPVRLMHRLTGRVLRTHDVASPLTTTNMEVTCADLDDKKSFEDSIFHLRLDQPLNNKDENGDLIPEYISKMPKTLRIISRPHSVALLVNKKKLPKWGFNDNEINGVKKPEAPGTVWGIDNIQSSVESSKDTGKIIIPKMGFFAKFWELQSKMLEHNAKLTKPHPYQSNPIIWPFMTRGVSFWTRSKEKAQIYYLSNPFGTVLSLVGIVYLFGLLIAIPLTARRNISLVDPLVERHLLRSGAMIAAAYILHYLPFFIMGRSLFIHHYLPGTIFGYMIIGVGLQYIGFDDYPKFALFSPICTRPNLPLLPKSKNFAIAIATMIMLQFVTFVYFAPLLYGTSMTESQIVSRKWLKSWDFQFLPKK